MSDGSGLGLKRTLNTSDLIIYGICFMIPIAPMAWYGDLVGPANGMVSLGYAIALVAMLFTGFSYSTMAHNFPIAGSVYSYVQRSTHPSLGFISGWAIMLDYVFLPAVAYLIGAMFMSALFPATPQWMWVVIFAVITTVLNALGINIMSKATWILFAIQCVCIAWFIIGSVVMISRGEANVNAVAFYNSSNFDLTGVLTATKVTILSYLGFDAISTLAEETKDPRKSIGRATIWSIISIGLLFVLLCWLAGVIFPQYNLLPEDTPFLTILAAVGGTPLVTLVSVSLVLSFGLACSMEGQTAITRILFSMSRDGIMPKLFSKLNRFRVPGIGIVFIGVVCVVVGIAVGLTVLASLLSFGALIGFMALNLAVIWRFFIKNPQKKAVDLLKFLVSPIIGFGVCIYIFVGGTDTLTWIVGGCWMAAGVIWLAIATKGFRRAAPTIQLDEASLDGVSGAAK
ncbi:MAG: APC family permease [Clostridiales bacterium]|nr:APC family permease [Clostridiales bacterium]